MTRFEAGRRSLGVLVLAGAAAAWFAAGPAAGASGPPATGPRAGAEAERAQERHPRVNFEIPCQECHERRTPEAVRDWVEGAHGGANVGCFICHGDGEVEFAVRPPMETCLTCHSERAVETDRLPAGGCFACHSGHRLTFHTE